MTESSLSRTLAVILHADVVGSTTLVQQDEALAHERMLQAFQRFSQQITTHGGTTHELRGDALIAEFERASDAVTASLAFQQSNRQFNESLSDDLCPELRIGISLGEVIIADGTITGSGVVLAQRLEQLAEPGGVVVQGSVAETVPTRLPFDFDSLGEQSLKGFEQPVRAFTVGLRPGEALPDPESGRAPTKIETQSPTPDMPSIAVLPFANMSNDPDQEYFADGIVEDIITALSHIKQWLVIARNSSFVYKGRNVDIREVARELGVRYVLEGSVRKSGNRLRITGQLIDAETGAHLWADKYDGELEEVFELQDRITESVVGAIEPSLRVAEIERSRRKPPSDISAYDLYLQALPLVYTLRPEPNQQAMDLLNQAIELDPDYALALAHLAWCYWERISRVWGAYGEDDAGTAIALAHRAIAADRNDALVLAIAGFALFMIARDYDKGLEAINRARELNPNIAFVSFVVGAILFLNGESETGLKSIEDAIRVSPNDPTAFLFYTTAAGAHLACGRADIAFELATKSTRMYDGWDTTYRFLAVALVQLDRLEEARAAVDKLLELTPALTVSGLRERWPIRNPETLDMILNSLRTAGLPE